MESTSLAGLSPSGARAAGASDDRGRGDLTTFVWVVGLVLFLIYGVMVKPLEWIWPKIDRGPAIDQTLLWLACKHPLIIAPIGAVLLVVAGRLGSSLGLPGLFRNPPPEDLLQEKRRRRNKGYLHSRGGATAFWGAFGVTSLTALVWTAVYFSEVFENLNLFPDVHFQRSSWRSAWEFVSDTGFWSHGELLWFLFWTCLPFLGLFLLAEIVPVPSAPGMDRRGKEFRREILQFAFGMVAGVLLIGLAKFGALLHWRTVRVWGHLYPAVRNLLKIKIGELESHPHGYDVTLTVLASFSMFPVVVLLFLG